MLLVHTSL